MKTCKKCNNKKTYKDFLDVNNIYCTECLKVVHTSKNKIKEQKKEEFVYNAAKSARTSAVKFYEKSLERLEKKECHWTEIWSAMVRLDALDYEILNDRSYSLAQIKDILS